MEIDDGNGVERDSNENPFGTDFMMQPGKLYKISFAGEQCQFSENSMLSVSIVEEKLNICSFQVL